MSVVHLTDFSNFSSDAWRCLSSGHLLWTLSRTFPVSPLVRFPENVPSESMWECSRNIFWKITASWGGCVLMTVKKKSSCPASYILYRHATGCYGNVPVGQKATQMSNEWQSSCLSVLLSGIVRWKATIKVVLCFGLQNMVHWKVTHHASATPEMPPEIEIQFI